MWIKDPHIWSLPVVSNAAFQMLLTLGREDMHRHFLYPSTPWNWPGDCVEAGGGASVLMPMLPLCMELMSESKSGQENPNPTLYKSQCGVMHLHTVLLFTWKPSWSSMEDIRSKWEWGGGGQIAEIACCHFSLAATIQYYWINLK